MPEIVPVYAGLLGLLFVYLSIRVIRARRQEQVALGDGECYTADARSSTIGQTGKPSRNDSPKRSNLRH